MTTFERLQIIRTGKGIALSDHWIDRAKKRAAYVEPDYSEPVELPYDQQMGAPGVDSDPDIDNPHDYIRPPHPLDRYAYRVGANMRAQSARKSCYSPARVMRNTKKERSLMACKNMNRVFKILSAKDKLVQQILATPGKQGNVIRRWNGGPLSALSAADIKNLLIDLATEILEIPVSARLQVNKNMEYIIPGGGAALCDLAPIVDYEHISDALLCLVISAMNEVQNFNINHILEIVKCGLDFDYDSMCFELIGEHISELPVANILATY